MRARRGQQFLMARHEQAMSWSVQKELTKICSSKGFSSQLPWRTEAGLRRPQLSPALWRSNSLNLLARAVLPGGEGHHPTPERLTVPPSPGWQVPGGTAPSAPLPRPKTAASPPAGEKMTQMILK